MAAREHTPFASNGAFTPVAPPRFGEARAGRPERSTTLRATERPRGKAQVRPPFPRRSPDARALSLDFELTPEGKAETEADLEGEFAFGARGDSSAIASTTGAKAAE